MSSGDLTRRPIFVVGFQRSGTTLLQALLGAHPHIAAPPETYFVLRIANLADYYGSLRDDQNLRRALHDLIYPPMPLFERCGFDEERLFDRARNRERTYAALFDTMMSDFAERNGKLRWSDKTPGQRAKQVLELFPNAQIIHIVRDPRDVIASSLMTPWTKLNAAALAYQWRRFTRENNSVTREAGARSVFEVRYEDLTRAPEEVLRSICDFLGEPFADEMILDPSLRGATVAPTAAPWQSRALEAIVPAVEGGWRKRLGLSDRARIAKILHREIEAFGYERATRLELLMGKVLEREQPLLRRKKSHTRDVADDPESRYRTLQAFLHEQASLIRSHTAPPADSRDA
jgi:hypothetical protein